MEVILKTDWFGPDHTLYRKNTGGTVTLLPDEFASALPSSAQVVGKAPYVAPEKDEEAGLTLRSFDDLRANSDATEEIINAQVVPGRVRKGA